MGRPLEDKPIDDTATRVSISWPKTAAPLLDTLNGMLRRKSFGCSRSDVIVNAIALVVGTADISKLEDLIVDRCAEGRLPRPKSFKNFEDILEWYIKQYGTIKGVMKVWGISKEEMARILFKHCLNFE